MSASRASTLTAHVEAARRLLRELEQHASAAQAALGRENSEEFFAAVEERERILAELDTVVEALAHERAWSGESGASGDPETGPLLAEMAAALKSHEQLVSGTRHERDRLAAALRRAKQPDTVADSYAAATGDPRPRTLSVTG